MTGPEPDALPAVLRGRGSRLLARLAAYGSDLVLLVDAERRVRWANAAARRVLGPTPAGDGGVLAEPLTRWVQDARLPPALSRALRSGQVVEAEVQEQPDGRSYRGLLVPMGERRRPDWALVLLRDDSAARRVTRTHQDLLANLSHDLRTPLAGLRLLAETLSGAARDDPQAMRTFAARIAIESDRLHTLVSGLLDLSRLEAGLDRTEPVPTDVRQAAAAVVERLQPQAERAGVEVVIEPGSCRALCDLPRFELALSNVLDNAVRFTPRGGRVTLTADEIEGEPVLTVADTGPGISATDLPRIFERFYTGDRARATPGSGLGLAIARHAVELQGGRIEARSGPGAGTRMRIWLRSV
ncbi:MAG TPA: HAMP domain-containing sensor histidine kinase [Candidatus Micrarchaeia archaeon]|nr:HAMP domain-containing sensor histidine kinase [Candidatus Micrarchaeia archaeon]